jgi:hypothetical protein
MATNTATKVLINSVFETFSSSPLMVSTAGCSPISRAVGHQKEELFKILSTANTQQSKSQ